MQNLKLPEKCSPKCPYPHLFISPMDYLTCTPCGINDNAPIIIVKLEDPCHFRENPGLLEKLKKPLEK